MPIGMGAAPTNHARIAILNTFAQREIAPVTVFVQRLANLGYVEGRNLRIDFRSAEGNPARLPDLVRDLVRHKPDVILTIGTVDSTVAAMKIAGTVPIVFALAIDPVRSGLVASLSRPGANVTGVSSLNADLDTKRLELVTEIAPGIRSIAVLASSSDPEAPELFKTVDVAARARGVRLQLLTIGDASQLDSALGDALRAGARALLVLGSPPLLPYQSSLARIAAKRVFRRSSNTSASGGLASYGTEVAELFLRAAGLVDRILQGAKPADLPVERPTKFELILNVRTARLLGLTIPPQVLLRAEHVIE